MTMTTVNPATGATIRRYPMMTESEVDGIVERVHRAQRDWRRTDFEHRAGRMRKAAAILRDDAGDLAVLMAEEMGKPVRDGAKEAEKCAWVCDWYADHAEEFLGPVEVETDARRSFVTYRPLGVILAIMPWNFPLWQVFRFAAPNLMGGNAGILKHASNVPGCALAIEEIFRNAEFPDDVFRTILVDKDSVERVIHSPHVAAVTLTGGTGAGKAVAAAAGAAIKKTVLELGGSDAYIVLEDADLEPAIAACVASRLINAGQSCIAAKRFLVVDEVREEFERRFVEGMRAVRMGDPLDERTEMGPQARKELRDDLHRQVQDSVARGARCLLGGEIPDGPGAFYPPTVLTDVMPGMPAHDEELFGPVAAIIPVRDEEDAVRVANDSPFGLGAAVFTRDRERGERIAAEELEAGACFVNASVRSDPRLPFGGVKESGYGRELSSIGIREFMNMKAVWID